MTVEGPERFTGGCLCGSVRIVASGRPYRVGVCHCLDCRTHRGTLFHASAIFPQEDPSLGLLPRRARWGLFSAADWALWSALSPVLGRV